MGTRGLPGRRLEPDKVLLRQTLTFVGTMKTDDSTRDTAVRHLKRCFAKKLCLGAPLCERFITPEEKEFEKRIRATYPNAV